MLDAAAGQLATTLRADDVGEGLQILTLSCDGGMELTLPSAAVEASHITLHMDEEEEELLVLEPAGLYGRGVEVKGQGKQGQEQGMQKQEEQGQGQGLRKSDSQRHLVHSLAAETLQSLWRRHRACKDAIHLRRVRSSERIVRGMAASTIQSMSKRSSRSLLHGGLSRASSRSHLRSEESSVAEYDAALPLSLPLSLSPSLPPTPTIHTLPLSNPLGIAASPVAQHHSHDAPRDTDRYHGGEEGRGAGGVEGAGGAGRALLVGSLQVGGMPNVAWRGPNDLYCEISIGGWVRRTGTVEGAGEGTSWGREFDLPLGGGVGVGADVSRQGQAQGRRLVVRCYHDRLAAQATLVGECEIELPPLPIEPPLSETDTPVDTDHDNAQGQGQTQGVQVEGTFYTGSGFKRKAAGFCRLTLRVGGAFDGSSHTRLQGQVQAQGGKVQVGKEVGKVQAQIQGTGALAQGRPANPALLAPSKQGKSPTSASASESTARVPSVLVPALQRQCSDLSLGAGSLLPSARSVDPWSLADEGVGAGVAGVGAGTGVGAGGMRGGVYSTAQLLDADDILHSAEGTSRGRSSNPNSKTNSNTNTSTNPSRAAVPSPKLSPTRPTEPPSIHRSATPTLSAPAPASVSGGTGTGAMLAENRASSAGRSRSRGKGGGGSGGGGGTDDTRRRRKDAPPYSASASGTASATSAYGSAHTSAYESLASAPVTAGKGSSGGRREG
ncbi:hypothetical protein B484DRAFT_264535, partial [Ochromonadaceae sp. CCMP2298]